MSSVPEGRAANQPVREATRMPPIGASLPGARARTSAFVAGRAAGAADLKLLGGRLLAFYGQHEHRRLTIASAQMDVLDGFAGEAQLQRLLAEAQALVDRAIA